MIFAMRFVVMGSTCISMNAMMEILTITMAVTINVRLRTDGNVLAEIRLQLIPAGD